MLRYSLRACAPSPLKQPSSHSAVLPSASRWHLLSTGRRQFRVLAIETSCDDTCVAVLDLKAWPGSPFRTAKLLYNERVTSDNLRYGGVHPLRAMESHQEKLAQLVVKAMAAPDSRVPDLVAVTRGPGMRNNLQCGLDTAKGLSVAWGVPLIGVHHMQAHALAPRLQDALAMHEAFVQDPKHQDTRTSGFPFLSLLVSGGHTLLVHTHSLTEHRILASTTDIAIGDCLDKVARLVLPQDMLDSSSSVAYGALLEAFAFDQPSPDQDGDSVDYGYVAPRTLGAEYEAGQVKNEYGWHFPTPLLTKDGKKFRAMEFSFGGIHSHVRRIVSCGGTHDTPRNTPMERTEAKVLAQRSMTSAFEHVASRIVLFLKNQDAQDNYTLQSEEPSGDAPIHLVVGGGVAANKYFRHILDRYISSRGFPNVKLTTVDPYLCTDNAAMIAWTAAEMVGATTADDGFQLTKAKFESNWSMRSIRKWSLENLLTPEKEEDREKYEEQMRDERQKQGQVHEVQLNPSKLASKTLSRADRRLHGKGRSTKPHPPSKDAAPAHPPKIALSANEVPQSSAQLESILASLQADPTYSPARVRAAEDDAGGDAVQEVWPVEGRERRLSARARRRSRRAASLE